MLYELAPPSSIIYEEVFIFIDPAAGGPGSDYGIMSVTRSRGILVVCVYVCVCVCFIDLNIPKSMHSFVSSLGNQVLRLDHLQEVSRNQSLILQPRLDKTVV